jgi:transposase InsO family protein
MAREFGVSRSGFYAWFKRRPSRREMEEFELVSLIMKIFDEHYKRYGSPRVWQELLNEYNWRVSEKRVARLMKKHGIRAKTKKKWKKTTDSDHDLAVAENLLNRDFTANYPGEKWVSDITYLPTANGWLYLTVIIDLWDRRVIGWNIAEDMRAENVCKAFQMAVINRQPGEGLIFHSDRGVQYCSQEFKNLLYNYCPTVRQSMSRKGNCWDNSCAESFFKTLKWEVEELNGKYKKLEVRNSVFEFIEIYYNKKRRHSALGYAKIPLVLTLNVA